MGVVGEEGANVSNPSLAPDGRHLVVQRVIQQNVDLWSLDLNRNVFRRLTMDPGLDTMPLWSPDGSRLVFNTAHSSATDNSATATLKTIVRRVDETSADEELPLPQNGLVKMVCDWSADGRFILYKQLDDKTGSDLWVLSMKERSPPAAVALTPYDERDGQFSPDGKWVAFESDESGRADIYLQPFPGPGAKVRVSTAGGSQVRWRRDGRELFYIDPTGYLMAVPVNPAAASAGIGAAIPLFKTRIAPVRTVSRQQYDVAPDGKRFLIVTTDQEPAPPVTLIVNWKPPLGR